MAKLDNFDLNEIVSKGHNSKTLKNKAKSYMNNFIVNFIRNICFYMQECRK